MATRKIKPEQWRNRIVRSDLAVPAADIMAHPLNPRIHPLDQRGAMVSMFDRIGWVMRVIVNETTGKLLDGHLRVEVAFDRGETVPVDYVDLTEAEEAEFLALADPIGQMATFDTALMETLTSQFDMPAELRAALDGIVHFEDEEAAVAPTTVTLKPLQRSHILISIPLDQWDEVSPILDQLDKVEGIEINSTVN